MTKEKKIIIGVIGLMLMAVVGIMLWQPILFRYLMYIELSCYCAYRFVEIWVLAPKLKKLASLEWWIYIVLVYVIIMQENIDLKETGTATIVSIGFVLFLLRMLVVYFQTNNCKEEIYISAMYIFILFYFAIVNSENYIGFWVFKILTVLFIFSMTKIINHTKRFWGVIIMLCVYLIMIAVSGALSSNFVSSLSVEAETSFYVAIRNLYTLPDFCRRST